jgi:hypothetical protein
VTTPTGTHLGEHELSGADLRDAADAVDQEYRSNSRTVRLQCLAVQPVAAPDDGIFALDVPAFADMDWCWEGARAFRGDGGETGRDYEWSGDVVEVDPVAGRVFVRSRADGNRPTIGTFRVGPYDYLRALYELYAGSLAAEAAEGLRAGLAGACGSLRAHALDASASLPALRGIWSRSWSCLWGPPGTGKTFTAGRQIAAAIADSTERILVTSTTNRATDAIALSIGDAVQEQGREVDPATVCRIGAGADIERYREKGLEAMLVGGLALQRSRLAALLRAHERAVDAVERARLWAQVDDVRRALSAGCVSIANAQSRVVVATVFSALSEAASASALRARAERGPPFTTVVVDEAGLVSRAAVAALALHASRRMLLVGDPKQLSPISKIARILPSSQARWLGASGLSHVHAERDDVLLLREQHRMHADIRRAVSAYQYRDALVDAASVANRLCPLGSAAAARPRAIWYVLDEDAEEIAHIRAERGPGNKSWVRRRSQAVVERIFRADPAIAAASGLFVTPFVAQARAAAAWLRGAGATAWQASTTHRQQGLEADVVVFDTVSASSTAWAHEEWKRLVNVGMSRARHLLVVLASRAEMAEPYLAELTGALAPRVLRGLGGQLQWHEVDARAPPARLGPSEISPNLGAQIHARRAMRPIFSAEQQRLCTSPLDGRPRLVRGVAGSGKTAILSAWVARRAAAERSPGPIWVVYANAALAGLLRRSIERAWGELGRADAFPWEQVELLHVLALLTKMEGAAGIRPPPEDNYEYDARASVLLRGQPAPRCRALFVDEAQDFGPVTLAYVAKLVEPSSPDEPSARAIHVFYDNAQNIYDRATPRWTELGLDMRGRSVVLKESFRSTRAIAEFALNALYRLRPPLRDPDHLELVRRGLLEREERHGRPWWRVRHNQVDGPPPSFRRFADREEELRSLGERVRTWIRDERVSPGDVRVVANDASLRSAAVTELQSALSPIGCGVEERTRQSFTEHEDSVIVTTAHSLKGYEGEIVAIVGADKFVAGDLRSRGGKRILPESLYVAMTRARSILYVSATTEPSESAGARVVGVLQACVEDLQGATDVPACSRLEERLELLRRVGAAHRAWLDRIASRFWMETTPVLRRDGSIAAEPLFVVRTLLGVHACFATPPTAVAREELAALGVRAIAPGDAID